jgi:hypothetical protein
MLAWSHLPGQAMLASAGRGRQGGTSSRAGRTTAGPGNNPIPCPIKRCYRDSTSLPTNEGRRRAREQTAPDPARTATPLLERATQAGVSGVRISLSSGWLLCTQDAFRLVPNSSRLGVRALAKAGSCHRGTRDPCGWTWRASCPAAPRGRRSCRLAGYTALFRNAARPVSYREHEGPGPQSRTSGWPRAETIRGCPEV